MAAGRVCTGFSHPYVAKYVNTEGVISYTSGQELARGVDITISPEAAGDNDFYADNVTAETAGGRFTGGTFSLTVDGLLQAAEKLIMGLPEATDGWYNYDNTQTQDYFGLAFIARYMSDGVTSYVPYILAKVAFDPLETSAATQEAEISWQTQAITGRILRDDSTEALWKKAGSTEYSEEKLAKAKIEEFFSI